jgi:hypothetical protein
MECMMTTMKMFRVAASVLLVTVSLTAHAGVQLSCPVQWEQLNSLKDANLNAMVMGVNVRDWTPEYLEQVRRKSEECSRSGSGSDSMRRAEHMDGVSRVYPAAKQFIVENAERVQQEKTRDQIGTSVQQSDLKQVIVLDSKGLPKAITIIYGPTGRAIKTCDVLSGGVGFATAESYGQAVQFARMCQQVGMTSATTVALLERQAAAVPALYKALDAFAERVKQLGATANPIESQLKELEIQQQKLSAQLRSLQLPNNDEAFVAASKTVAGMRERAQTAACGEQAVKAGFPASWKVNYIMMEWNSPELFCNLVQAAQRNGAQMRYLPSGLLSKEGFEVKSAKRTVQIFTQANRIPGGDPNVQIMVPVTARIDGKSVEVTRTNLRAVAAELIAAMRNQ